MTSAMVSPLTRERDNHLTELPSATGYDSHDKTAQFMEILNKTSATGTEPNRLWHAPPTQFASYSGYESHPIIRVTVGSPLAPNAEHEPSHVVSELAGSILHMAQAMAANSAFPFVLSVVGGIAPAMAGAVDANLAATLRAITEVARRTRIVSIGHNDVELEADSSILPPRLYSAHSSTLSSPHEAPVRNADSPDHARLAREVRDLSGLSSTTLASALGVTREQYSRWVSGKPISTPRHGQLQFIHTLVRDLVRRLGEDKAKLWLRTPRGDNRTPADLLTTRRLDLLHSAIVQLPDPNPVIDGVIVSLMAPSDSDDDLTPDDDPDGQPWCPYEAGGEN